MSFLLIQVVSKRPSVLSREQRSPGELSRSWSFLDWEMDEFSPTGTPIKEHKENDFDVKINSFTK